MNKLIWILFLAMLSCGNNPNGENNAATADSASLPPGPTDTPMSQNEDTAALSSAPGADSVISLPYTTPEKPLDFTIEKDYQRVYLLLRDVHSKKLQASLKTPDSSRNIRFSQIIMPDSSSDGPFGSEFTYATGQKGTYTLIIARNNMAEGKTSGPVTVTIHFQ